MSFSRTFGRATSQTSKPPQCVRGRSEKLEWPSDTMSRRSALRDRRYRSAKSCDARHSAIDAAEARSTAAQLWTSAIGIAR